MATEWHIKGHSTIDLNYWKSLRLKVHRLENGSFMATVIEGQYQDTVDGQMNNLTLQDLLNQTFTSTSSPDGGYDDAGALYYVVAVVFIYGFSIILMIGSLIRKSQGDRGMSVYMKDMDKVRRLERRQEKFKIRLFMQHKKIHKILGQDRAIIVDNNPESGSAKGATAKEDTKSESRGREDSQSKQGHSRLDSDTSLWSLTKDTCQDVSASYPLLHPPSTTDGGSASTSPSLSPCPSPKYPHPRDSMPQVCIEIPPQDSTSYSIMGPPSPLTEPAGAGAARTASCSSRDTLDEMDRAQLCTLLEEEEESTLV